MDGRHEVMNRIFVRCIVRESDAWRETSRCVAIGPARLDYIYVWREAYPDYGVSRN